MDSILIALVNASCRDELTESDLRIGGLHSHLVFGTDAAVKVYAELRGSLVLFVEGLVI